MEQDPGWLAILGAEPGRSVASFSLGQGTQERVVPFLVHPSRLQYRLGESTLFSLPVRRHVLVGEPDLGAAGGGAASLTALLRALREGLQGNDVVFLQSIPVAGPLHRALTASADVRRDYHVIPHGAAYQHRRAAFEGSHVAYLASLRRSTRRDLRRSRRKFEARTGGRHEVRCFTTETEVVQFLEEASGISEGTYQCRLLGLGLRDTPCMRTRLRSAARKGWLRAYILYAEGRPIAFQLGYLHRTTYYAEDTGYAPDWSKCHAGVFLLTEMLADLAPVADVFDFLDGDDLLKSRLGNRSRLEQSFYLVPRTLRGGLIAHSLRGINALSAGLGALFARVRLKESLRRMLRARSVARTTLGGTPPATA